MFGFPIFNQNKPGFKLFEKQQALNAAQEPSDIVWENFGKSKTRKNCLKVAVTIIMTIILFCILSSVAYLKTL